MKVLENNLSHAGLVEVRSCPHGKGLFASRDMPLPTMIIEIQDVKLISTPTSPSEKSFALRVGQSEYWDESPPESALYWTHFIDHSNHPNAVFVFNVARTTAWFVTTQPIKKDEELFISYSSYYSENPTVFSKS